MKRLILLSLLVSGLVFMSACSKDDSTSNNDNDQDAWVGTWLSAGDNVAPLLSTYFFIDSIRVQFNDDNTVTTDQHVSGGAWTSLSGTYAITEAASGDVHSIEISYTTYDQEGIVQIIDGTPTTLKLEVVQTLPDIGATPRTPETGFGSDATLGTSNIQVYEEVE